MFHLTSNPILRELYDPSYYDFSKLDLGRDYRRVYLLDPNGHPTHPSSLREILARIALENWPSDHGGIPGNSRWLKAWPIYVDKASYYALL